MLSIIVPVRNESENLDEVFNYFTQNLQKLDFEVLIINDFSEDDTFEMAKKLSEKNNNFKVFENKKKGLGGAINLGIVEAKGEFVAIMMADRSDSPLDLVKYWNTLQDGYECVMGSRFIHGGKVINYPKVKLIVNRIVNMLIKYAFKIDTNDITNAFKMYRREVILGCQPLISPHFNLTVEIPLKAIIRGYSWKVVPISWKNRQKGEAKLKLKEMGSRYFFIVAYLWLEKYFSRGDYKRKR